MRFKSWISKIRNGELALSMHMSEKEEKRFCTGFDLNVKEHFVPTGFGDHIYYRAIQTQRRLQKQLKQEGVGKIIAAGDAVKPPLPLNRRHEEETK